MLQNRGKERLYFLFPFLLLLLWTTGCKEATTSQSEEEATYLADFEAPANKWGYMDKLGQLVIKPIYDDVGTFSEGLAAVNISGKWGYIDRQGNVVIEPRFKSAWPFQEKKARVEPFDQPSYFIDKTGNTLSSDQWAAADDFSGGLAKVLSGSLYGYIDAGGNLLIKAIYSRGWNFENGMAVVEYEEHLSVINPFGHCLIPGPFDHIKINAEDQLILCRKGETSIVYDSEGNEITRQENAKFIESGGNLISARQKENMYFFDLRTKQFIKDQVFSNIIYLGERRWAGKKEEGYALLDQDGKIMNEKRYTQINKFSNSFAAYNADEYWGYMDLMGISITEEVFGLAWDYREGLARAAFQEGIAFIDDKQKLAFYPPEGTMDMRDFSEGLAPIQISR